MKTSIFIRRVTCAIMIAVSASAVTYADERPASKSPEVQYPIRKKDKTPAFEPLPGLVIVDGDTVSMILPERNWGRFDRGLFNYLFLPKGQWMAGLNASYASFDAENVAILDVLKDFDFNGEMYSIRPYISYVFSNNNTVGLKFNYIRSDARLGNLSVEFDEDTNFDIRDVHYYDQSFGASVFYRHYIGLSRAKRFGVFNEVDLSFNSGSGRFRRTIGGVSKETSTTTTSVALNFSPGLTVFVMDYVSFNISFGVFGVHLTNQHQITDGVDEGSRFSSGANFKFNIFNINFGLGVHI